MGCAFRFTQTNSTPFSGLDGSVTFSDGTESTYKLLILSKEGVGFPPLTPQTQKAPFQQGESAIRTLFAPRMITIECAISVPGNSVANTASIATIKRALGHALSPVGMGFLPDTSLTTSNYSTYLGQLAYASDGTTYDRYIDVIPVDVQMPNKFYKDGFQHIRVVFFCPNPFWYGAINTQTMSAVPNASLAQWNSIAWSPTLKLFCAVSDNGTDPSIMTSPDGLIWTGHNVSENNLWVSITWSPTKALFCAVSQNGTHRIMTSPDGTNWTMQTAAAVKAWGCVTWSEEKALFIALSQSVASDGQSSPDGVSWTSFTSSGNHTWVSIVWSKELGIFCAVAEDGSVQTSNNGTAWTSRTAAEANTWECVTWSREKSLFVAVAATGTHRVMTSPTGVTWTAQTAAEANSWRGIIWNSSISLFVAVAQNGAHRVMTSPDAVTWSTQTAATANIWKDITLSPTLGAMVAVPRDATQYPMVSYDGLNWISSSVNDYYYLVTNAGDLPTDFTLTVPVIGGESGKYIAIGDNFLWAGTGTPPSDHNIVFATTSLVLGNVVLTTKFGSKTITQFGTSYLANFTSGTFFQLYVTGSSTNNIYVRNTGTTGGAPTISWYNRYLTV